MASLFALALLARDLSWPRAGWWSQPEALLAILPIAAASAAYQSLVTVYWRRSMRVLRKSEVRHSTLVTIMAFTGMICSLVFIAGFAAQQASWPGEWWTRRHPANQILLILGAVWLVDQGWLAAHRRRVEASRVRAIEEWRFLTALFVDRVARSLSVTSRDLVAVAWLRSRRHDSGEVQVVATSGEVDDPSLLSILAPLSFAAKGQQNLIVDWEKLAQQLDDATAQPDDLGGMIPAETLRAVAAAFKGTAVFLMFADANSIGGFFSLNWRNTVNTDEIVTVTTDAEIAGVLQVSQNLIAFAQELRLREDLSGERLPTFALGAQREKAKS